jgi:hypothetical protein
MGKGDFMRSRLFKSAAVVCIFSTLVGYQNCSPQGVHIEENPEQTDLSSDTPPMTSPSPSPAPTRTPTPTPTPKATPTPYAVSCSSSAHRILAADGVSCVCDFANGYYEENGNCVQSTALQDVCSPRPATCGGVSLPAPVYNFDFNTATMSGKNVSFFTSATGMQAIGAGTPTIRTENVCGLNRNTLNFTKGTGLRQLSTSSLYGDYSVAILFRFNFQSGSCSSSWARIFDNKNNSIDNGLYMFGSGNKRNLQYFNFSAGNSRSVGSEYAWVTFTKQGRTIAGYVNRQLQWQHDDASAWSDLTAAKDMIFFKDDTRVPNEECEGAVAKIMVFSSALNKTQAECLAF